MQEIHSASFIETTWEAVASRITQLNPDLSKIIDEISPDRSYKLYLGQYPYGNEFVRNGKFYIPSGNKFLSIDDPQVKENLKESLGYNKYTNPVCMLLKNQAELYIERGLSEVPIPFGLLQPGRIFSTAYVLSKGKTYHPRFKWNISAGARSIFLLPKITNKRHFNRLSKALMLSSEIPRSYEEHWNLFKEMCQATKVSWELEALFFSKKWFERLNDPAWIHFYNYLLVNYYEVYQFWTYKFMWDIAYSFILKKLGVKPSLYIANSVKHLLFVSTGSVCGMAPALNNEAAPIAKLQDIIVDIYNLKNYAPTIMIPHFFNLYVKSNPVYYSFQYPNLMEMTLRPRQHESVLTDVYETYSLLKKILRELQSEDLNLYGSPLYDIVDRVEFDVFHTESEPYYAFKKTTDLTKGDPHLIKTFKSYPENQTFSDNASFVRGCIRISKKSE